jgi:predicted ATPase
MIQLLQVRNFRMLRSNSVAIQPFQVLVGQNATGKSTFLGALQFIGDVLKGGVHSAVDRRAGSFYDLCFDVDEPIAFAVELAVPGGGERRRRRLRYEVEIGIDPAEGLRILRESLFILPSVFEVGASLFGVDALAAQVFHKFAPKGWRRVVSKSEKGIDTFRDERTDWDIKLQIGPDKAALGSLLADQERFPLSLAARKMLRNGIRTLVLDAARMRNASPPGRSTRMALDGSNLPHVVRAFQRRDEVLFGQWVKHVANAVEGLKKVEVREREEDRFLVLQARFGGQHSEPVPSWMLSDGTLRLMALTLLSYAATEDDVNIYLIEEPENGLHPLAIQIAYEALASPPASSQILCATHSPIFLAQAKLDQTLVFRRSQEGFSIVRRGPEIPELVAWSDRVSLPDLFVTGVLA